MVPKVFEPLKFDCILYYIFLFTAASPCIQVEGMNSPLLISNEQRKIYVNGTLINDTEPYYGLRPNTDHSYNHSTAEDFSMVVTKNISYLEEVNIYEVAPSLGPTTPGASTRNYTVYVWTVNVFFSVSTLNRGTIVNRLEQLGYDAESRRKVLSSRLGFAM